MTVEQGTSQPNPSLGGQFAAESADRTEVSELDGLLGDPIEPDPELDAGAEGDPDDEGHPGGEENPDDPDGEGNTPDAKALKDEAKVALDDGREVTVKELKETFSTFTRKTQELAETQRSTLAQAREAVANYAQQQAHELHLIGQRLEQLVAPGMDEAALQRLAYENPEQFYQVKARIDVVRDFRAGIQRQVAELVQQAQQQRNQAAQETQQAHQQLLQTENAKLDGQKWFTADFRNKALAFAKKHGIPEQVAGSVAYAGFVDITRKAMLYDEAMARTKGGKQPPQQARVTPGSTPASGALKQAKQVHGAYETARKSGDKRAAGAWLNKVL
jgi:hypothetical protein